MPEMPIAAIRYIASIRGRLPQAGGESEAKSDACTSPPTPEDSTALFIATFCRHGKDGRSGDDPRPTKLEDRLAAMTDPSITNDNALEQCYDLGLRLAEFFSQDPENTVKPSQFIFLSSPVERALQTAEQAISGISDYYKKTQGESTASLMNATIHVLGQLRERLDGSTRDWHASRTAIAAKHPTADVSRMDEENDPAQSGDLHLIPDDDERSEARIPMPGRQRVFTSPAARFINRPRGVLESLQHVDELDRNEATRSLRTHQFEERLVSLGDIMSDIARTHRLETGSQPVFVVFSHYLTVNRFISWTHDGETADIPRVYHHAECAVSTYNACVSSVDAES